MLLLLHKCYDPAMHDRRGLNTIFRFVKYANKGFKSSCECNLKDKQANEMNG
jgi:hypothetical protein